MESTKNAVTKKGKKPQSPTRYPKRMPTFVVAFAAQETFDDPQKVQLITDKRSAENSTPSLKSISPTDSTNSTKTFTISPTENLSSVLDIATLSEVKFDIIDENQCGDVQQHRSPQMSSYIIFDNRPADDQLDIIFNAPKHIQRRNKDKHKFPRKKPRKSKPVSKFNNVQFKYKKTRNSFSRRLKNYYEKTKLNTPTGEQFQKEIYCNVLSNVVSRSRVLKKVLAKVNLADADRISSHDAVNLSPYDDDSLFSSPPNAKKSFLSYASQKTLVRKDSSPSTNDDFYSMKTVISLNQVPSVKQIPYKSEIINVALAVELNAPEINDESTGTCSEKFIHTENLTSSETLLQSNTTELTSQPPSSEEPPQYFVIDYNDFTLNDKIQSENTLITGMKSVEEVCSKEDDAFLITRKSSDFNKSSVHSDYTLTFNSQTSLRTGNVQSCVPISDEPTNNDSKPPTLLDKVKNLGFYPMKTPSFGSSVNYGELNDVLVTDNMGNSLPVTSQNTTDVKNKFPADLSELWERLTLVLDLAVKRLEDTLTDRIVKDIRESLPIFKQHEYQIPTIEIQRAETTAAQVNYKRPIPIMLHKEIFVIEEHLKQDADICVQCDLIQKQMIDQLMLKLSEEAALQSSPEAPQPSPVEALKILKPPELVEDYVKIVKPPGVLENDSTSIEMGKGDTVTVSTATTELSSSSGFKQIKLLLRYQLEFIRENIIVLTGIPTFFIVLFCIYGIIVLIMQPM